MLVDRHGEAAGGRDGVDIHPHDRASAWLAVRQLGFHKSQAGDVRSHNAGRFVR